MHPLSWALQFCNIKGLSGRLSSSESQTDNICEVHFILDQPTWFRGASSIQFWGLKGDPDLANESIIFPWPLGRSREGSWPHQNRSQSILGTLGQRNRERGTLLKLGKGKCEAAGGSHGRRSCPKVMITRNRGDKFLPMPCRVCVQWGPKIS